MYCGPLQDPARYVMIELSAEAGKYPNYLKSLAHLLISNNLATIVWKLCMYMSYMFSVYDYGTFGFMGAFLAGGHTMVADNWSKSLHAMVRGLKRNLPQNWTLVNAKKIKKTKVNTA